MYRVLLSPFVVALLGHGCRYELSCSEYTVQKVEKDGVLKGLSLGARRLATCHPFSGAPGKDYV